MPHNCGMDYLARLRQSRRPTFRRHVSVLLGSGIILLTLVLTILVEVAARRQLANEVGIALNEAAFQAATELERIATEHQQILMLVGQIETPPTLIVETLQFIATVAVVPDDYAPIAVVDGQMQVAAPLANESLVGTLDKEMLQAVLAQLLEPLPQQTELFVYTRDGVPFMTAGSVAEVLPAETVAQLVEGGEPTAVWPSGERFLVGSAFSAELDLLVVVRQQSQHALTATRQLQRQIWGIGLVVGLLFWLLGSMMVERITKPLASMAASARFISEGNREHTIPLYQNTLETELLSVALRELIGVSHRLQRELEQKVEDRTQTLTVLYKLLSLATRSQDVEAWFSATVAQLRTATMATESAIFVMGVDQLVQRAGNGAFDRGRLRQVVQGGAVVNSAETIYAPLKTAGKTVGVLALRRAEPFTPDQLALITSVADQLGLMLNSLRLQTENKRLLIVEERNRLARELHDAVTQSLYSLTLMSNALRHQQQLGNDAVVDEIATEIATSSQAALREMRLMLHNLRPSDVSKLGLGGALQQRLAAVEKRAGIAIEAHIDKALHLPASVEDALYFIAVEALNNALRHAHSDSVAVGLQQSADVVTLTIRDFGHGFDPSTVSDGFGLRNMQERVAQIGGTLHIESQPQQGTTLTIRIAHP